MVMQMSVINPGGDPSSPLIVDVDADPPKRPVDAHRYATFNFTGKVDIPVLQYARIVLQEDGKVHFRGYVYYWKKEGQKLTIQCRGEEELLMHRYSPRHGWQMAGGPDQSMNTIYLSHIFEDTAPSQVVDPLGVIHNSGGLFLANSFIPQFKWTAYDIPHWIWKLPGWGTNSRIGSAALYIEGLLLPRQASYAACAALENSSYADVNDLYVNLDGTTYIPAWLLHLSALNGFDTGVRRGQIDKANTPLTGNLQLNVNRWADVFISMATFYGLTVHWRYGLTNTYLDAINES